MSLGIRDGFLSGTLDGFTLNGLDVGFWREGEKDGGGLTSLWLGTVDENEVEGDEESMLGMKVAKLVGAVDRYGEGALVDPKDRFDDGIILDGIVDGVLFELEGIMVNTAGGYVASAVAGSADGLLDFFVGINDGNLES